MNAPERKLGGFFLAQNLMNGRNILFYPDSFQSPALDLELILSCTSKARVCEYLEDNPYL